MVFDNLGTSQHIEYPSLQVTNIQEGVEAVILQPPQCIHPDTNDLDALANPLNTMTTYISATTTLTSYISDPRL